MQSGNDELENIYNAMVDIYRQFSRKNDCSNLVRFSTSASYQGQIEMVLAEYTPM